MSTGLPDKTTPREDEELLLMEEKASSVTGSGTVQANSGNQETEEIEEEVNIANIQSPAERRGEMIKEEIVEDTYIPTGQTKPKNMGKEKAKGDTKSKTTEFPPHSPPSSSSQRLNVTATPDMITISNPIIQTEPVPALKQLHSGSSLADINKENSKPVVVNVDNVQEVPGGDDKGKAENERKGDIENLEIQEELAADENMGKSNELPNKGNMEIQEPAKEHMSNHQREGEEETRVQDREEGEEDEDEKIEYDTTWMHKLKGKDLLKEAEAIISASMLCIDRVNSPPHWKEVLGEDGNAIPDKSISIKKILEIWTQKFEHYPPNLPAALCLRFSKFYNSQFSRMLKAAHQSDNIANRNILIRRVWTEHMTPGKVKAICNESCLLNIPSMVSFFRVQDELMIIAECHLARLSSDPAYIPPKIVTNKDGNEAEDDTQATPTTDIQPHQDPRNVELTPGESEKLIRRMGMINIGVSLLDAIQARVLSCCRVFDSQHCTVGELIEYCTARGKIPMVDTYADREPDTNASKDDSNDEEITRDQAGFLRDLLSTSGTSLSVLQHAQIYMKKIGEKVTVEAVEKEGLLKYLYEHLGLYVSRDYLNSLLYLMEEPSTSTIEVIKLSSILQFCYPFGYTFKVRTVLGSVYYRDKFSPTDSTEKLFKLVTAQMQDGLRKRLPISAQLKVISDLVLYADKEKTIEIIRSNSRILAEFINHGVTIYAFSRYTDSMVVQHVEQQTNWPGKELGAEVVPPPEPKKIKPPPQAELAKLRKEKGDREVEERKKETAIKKNIPNAETNGASASAPRSTNTSSSTAAGTKTNYPWNKTERMAADDPMITAIMGPGTVKVKIPSATPFTYPETEADTWPIVVMLKYLKLVIELPQYENDFLRCELSGSEFLTLSELRMGTLGVSNKLHQLKLLAHVKKLKDKVFAKRIKQLSHEIDQWHAGHIAAWLHIDINTPLCATSILKSKANGVTLVDLYIDEDDKPLRYLLEKTSANEDEIVRAIGAIKDKFYPHLNASPGAVHESKDANEVTGKKETAMAKKRRLKAEAKAKEVVGEEQKMKQELDISVEDGGLDEIRDRESENFNNGQIEHVSVDEMEGLNQEDSVRDVHEGKQEEQDVKSNVVQMNATENDGDHRLTGEDFKPSENDELNEETDEQGVDLGADILEKEEVLASVETPEIPSRSSSLTTGGKSKKKKKRKDYKVNFNALTKDIQQQDHHEHHHDDSLYIEKIEELENVLSNKIEMEARSVLTLKETVDMMARELKKKDEQKKRQEDMMVAQLRQLESSNKATISMLDKVSKSYMEAVEDQKSLMKQHERDVAKMTSVLEAAATVAVTKPPTAPLTSPVQQSAIVETDGADAKPPLAPTTKKDTELFDQIYSDKESEDLKDSNLILDGLGHDKALRAEEAKIRQDQESLATSRKKVSIAVTPHERTGEAPMQLAQRKLNSPKFHVNVSAAMEESFESEVDNWIELSEYYRLDADVMLGDEDSRAALTKIALLWTRLGAQMLVDAEVPSKSTSSETAVVNEGIAASVLKNSSSQSVGTGMSGSSPGWSAKFIPLLKGMKMCAEIALNDLNQKKKDVDAPCLLAKYIPLKTDLSVVMVYTLGLIRKLIEKYTRVSTGDMHSNLVFLLNGIKVGTFPLTELSRDDLKTCLDFQLGLTFSAWDRYDSVCNLIDKGGFINFQNVLLSFQYLPPFSAWLSLEDAATVTMTLLSICEEVWLGDANIDNCDAGETDASSDVVHESFEKAVMLLLVESKDHIQSFRSLLTGDERHNEPSMQLIADLMYDMTRRFINKRCNTKYQPDSVHLTFNKEPIIFDNKKFSAIEFLQYNLKFACGHLARSLQIYDSNSCLDDFGSLLVTHLHYRSMVLMESKAKEIVIVKSLNNKQTKFYASKIVNIEKAISHLTSNCTVSARESISNDANYPSVVNLTSLDAAENVFNELLGIPVYSDGGNGDDSVPQNANIVNYRQLTKSQLHAELSIIRKQAPGLRGTDSTHHLGQATNSMLSDIKKNLNEESEKSANDAEQKRNPPTTLIEDMTERMRKQRLEVIASYLKILNDRAEGRRYALETLMHLRASTKVDFTPETETRKAMYAVQLPPIVPMNKKAIMAKAKDIRLHLVEEIQGSEDKEEATLCRRVNRIKEALINGSLPDREGDLSRGIREVEYLEKMLLQCSKDILELSTRIIEKLKS